MLNATIMSKVSFGESETIEFKESLSELPEGAETLCGFENQNGGVLYFGIKNNHEVMGIPNITEKTIRDLSQHIYDNLEPQNN
ncbi:MAG: ATP-binding protein [bacterium]|nr:ATP-binding protein [bacterium]